MRNIINKFITSGYLIGCRRKCDRTRCVQSVTHVNEPVPPAVAFNALEDWFPEFQELIDLHNKDIQRVQCTSDSLAPSNLGAQCQCHPRRSSTCYCAGSTKTTINIINRILGDWSPTRWAVKKSVQGSLVPMNILHSPALWPWSMRDLLVSQS